MCRKEWEGERLEGLTQRECSDKALHSLAQAVERVMNPVREFTT